VSTRWSGSARRFRLERKKGEEMSDLNKPHDKHSDDAVADDAAPTDAVTDEVRDDAARSENVGGGDLPDEPAVTHP
jgi:hypothetical protein